MYLSTTVARLTVYRSRPRSAAITSADIVLPVPESPANSAVTPRAAAAAAAHPPLRRARGRGAGPAPASSRSCARTAAGSTRSSQPTSGSIRRASRSSPAAFCARAPRRRSSPVIGPAVQQGSGPRRRARPGRPGPGPRTRWPSPRRVEPRPRSPRCAAPQRRPLVGRRAPARRRSSGTPSLHGGSQVAGADEQHRHGGRASAGAGRRRARRGQRLDRAGDEPAAAQQRLPAGRPASGSRVGCGRQSGEVHARARAARPAERRDREAPRRCPARGSRTWTSRTPGCSARRQASARAGPS